MNKAPLLIVFLGFPGSGKTYFATRLAERIRAVTINSDALRVSMFGSMDRIDQIRKTDESRLYRDVFGAMDYATMQILLAGHSVVYDAQQTRRENRDHIAEMAFAAKATPIFVWMRTDEKVAFRRAQNREARSDSHQYSEETIRRIMDWSKKRLELPGVDENFIEISGELPFEHQYELFRKGVDEREN